MKCRNRNLGISDSDDYVNFSFVRDLTYFTFLCKLEYFPEIKLNWQSKFFSEEFSI